MHLAAVWYFASVRKGRGRDVVPGDLSCRVLRSGEPEVVLLSFTPPGRERLTEAERDVALAVARGLSNAAIATSRGRSPRTIANQVAAIMKKLGVSSRVELAAQFDALDLV